MSILSSVDFIKELGLSIYVYPLNDKNLKGGSLNLTASKLAWSVKSTESIYDKNDDLIRIPAHDTALVETEEAIYVNNKISGTYHSPVRLVSKGIGHIGTTLDPGYKGPSLIALHNILDRPVDIKVGETIATLTLTYLKNITDRDNTNSAGRNEILDGYHKTEDEKKWLDEDWRVNEKALLIKMQSSSDYKNLKAKINAKYKFAKSPYFINFYASVICLTCIGLLSTFRGKLSMEYKDFIPSILTVYAAFSVAQVASLISKD